MVQDNHTLHELTWSQATFGGMVALACAWAAAGFSSRKVPGVQSQHTAGCHPPQYKVPSTCAACRRPRHRGTRPVLPANPPLHLHQASLPCCGHPPASASTSRDAVGSRPNTSLHTPILGPPSLLGSAVPGACSGVAAAPTMGRVQRQGVDRQAPSGACPIRCVHHP